MGEKEHSSRDKDEILKQKPGLLFKLNPSLEGGQRPGPTAASRRASPSGPSTRLAPGWFATAPVALPVGRSTSNHQHFGASLSAFRQEKHRETLWSCDITVVNECVRLITKGDISTSHLSGNTYIFLWFIL